MTNLYGFSGKERLNNEMCVKIWQLLDIYHNQKITERYTNFNVTDTEFCADYINGLNLFNPNSSEWKRKSFDNKVKQMVCLITGCKIQELEDEQFLNSNPYEWVNVPAISYGIDQVILYPTNQDVEWVIDNYPETNKRTQYTLTYRELIQYMNDKVMSYKFHPDIHINMLFVDYTLYNNGLLSFDLPKWLISDVKSTNEENAIIARDGKVIKIDDTIINTEDFIYEIKNIMITENIINPTTKC